MDYIWGETCAVTCITFCVESVRIQWIGSASSCHSNFIVVENHFVKVCRYHKLMLTYRIKSESKSHCNAAIDTIDRLANIQKKILDLVQMKSVLSAPEHAL